MYVCGSFIAGIEDSNPAEGMDIHLVCVAGCVGSDVCDELISFFREFLPCACECVCVRACVCVRERDRDLETSRTKLSMSGFYSCAIKKKKYCLLSTNNSAVCASVILVNENVVNRATNEH